MFSHLFDSLRRSLLNTDPPGEPLRRVEVCPPALARTAQSEPVGLRDWISATWLDSTSQRRPQRRPEQRAVPLLAVRAEFAAAISGIHDPRAARLDDGIQKARSLRELWHLRADVYAIVSTHADEAEAQRRVGLLNRHFPTRIARPPRTSF